MDQEFFDESLNKDNFIYLRIREAQTKCFKKAAPQMPFRRMLVDWISLVSADLGLCNSTIHLGIKYLDYFMDGHSIEGKQLKFVAMGCILLAAKCEEMDRNIPRLKTARLHLSETYSHESFTRLEEMICVYFEWKVHIPTPLLFCELMLPSALTTSDAFCGQAITNFSDVQRSFREHLKYFEDVSLQNEDFLGLPSSTVACGIIYATRQAVSLSPTWSSQLQEFSGFVLTDSIKDVGDKLISTYTSQRSEIPNGSSHRLSLNDQNPVALTPDVGYSSGSPSSDSDEVVIVYEAKKSKSG